MAFSKMKYPKALEELIESFKMLPGIGPKTAERLAFHIITKTPKEKVEVFSESLKKAVSEVRECKKCGMITDKDVCDICTDESREKVLVIVENTKDAIVLEKTIKSNYKYHVLKGAISPLNGVTPDVLNIDSLLLRVGEEQIEEVILATSATVEGEVTALYLSNLLSGKGVKISRIGYGLPAGADIEYADEITLIKALESRKVL